MKPENFKKGIEELRRAGLTKSEKGIILQKIMETPIVTPVPQASFFSLVREVFAGYSRLSYAFVAVLIFLFSGSSVMYAAERAVPGDILYRVKTDVTEPLRDRLIKKPEARAEWEIAKAVRRLEEAETLAREKKLDEPRRAKLERDFEKHADRAEAAIGEIEETKPVATGTEIVTGRIKRKFDSEASSHKKILENIGGRKDISEREKKEIESMKKAIDRKVQGERNRAKDRSQSGAKY